jgi:YD repeat-containing protein
MRLFLTALFVVVMAINLPASAQITYDGPLIYHNVADLTYIDDTLYGPVKQVTVSSNWAGDEQFTRSLVLDEQGNIVIDVGYREEGALTLLRHEYDDHGDKVATTFYESHVAIIEVEFARTLLVTNPRMSGDDVTALQQALVDQGYDVGEVDGIYGPMTEAAVRVFQEAEGLEPDGIAGPITWHLAVLPLVGRFAYKRDANGELVLETLLDGGITYRYDDLGRPVEIISYGEGEVVLERTTLSYTTSNTEDLVEAETFDAAGNLISRQLSIYTLAGELLRRNLYRANHLGAGESFRWLQFDEGRLVEEGFATDTGDVRHLYRYDDLGNWTSYTICGACESTVQELMTYEFDGVGNWTHRTFYAQSPSEDGSSLTPSYTETRVVRYHDLP